MAPSERELSHVTVAPLHSGEMNDSFIAEVARLFGDLVGSGAALGWIDPPSAADIAGLFTELAQAIPTGDAFAGIARNSTQELVGAAYWRRYRRPTNRVHADLERLVVRGDYQQRGIGARLLKSAIDAARRAGIEQLTLDSRGDNTSAFRLWRRFGFVEYGRLRDFVAVGDARYDKTLWVLDLRAS